MVNLEERVSAPNLAGIAELSSAQSSLTRGASSPTLLDQGGKSRKKKRKKPKKPGLKQLTKERRLEQERLIAEKQRNVVKKVSEHVCKEIGEKNFRDFLEVLNLRHLVRAHTSPAHYSILFLELCSLGTGACSSD